MANVGKAGGQAGRRAIEKEDKHYGSVHSDPYIGQAAALTFMRQS